LASRCAYWANYFLVAGDRANYFAVADDRANGGKAGYDNCSTPLPLDVEAVGDLEWDIEREPRWPGDIRPPHCKARLGRSIHNLAAGLARRV